MHFPRYFYFGLASAELEFRAYERVVHADNPGRLDSDGGMVSQGSWPVDPVVDFQCEMMIHSSFLSLLSFLSFLFGFSFLF
jgi:hypothetical protein